MEIVEECPGFLRCGRGEIKYDVAAEEDSERSGPVRQVTIAYVSSEVEISVHFVPVRRL